MKLLLDQGLPRSTTAALLALGHDAVHTGDIGLSTASDEDILARALHEGRVVVTLDADFHAILARTAASGPSVLRMRVEGLAGDAMARVIHRVLTSIATDLARGAAASSDGTSVRFRTLPLV